MSTGEYHSDNASADKMETSDSTSRPDTVGGQDQGTNAPSNQEGPETLTFPCADGPLTLYENHNFTPGQPAPEGYKEDLVVKHALLKNDPTLFGYEADSVVWRLAKDEVKYMEEVNQVFPYCGSSSSLSELRRKIVGLANINAHRTRSTSSPGIYPDMSSLDRPRLADTQTIWGPERSAQRVPTAKDLENELTSRLVQFVVESGSRSYD